MNELAIFKGDDGQLRELALFAGAGGGILGGKLLGWRTVCAVEWDAYAASVLVARQNDKTLEPFPIWDDVQTFDGRPWRGIVDVVSGGFPCQDISSAGKGAGINGERSGLWKQMLRISEEVRPKYIFIENSPLLRTRGLVTVLQDLAKIGYDAEWTVMGADDVGAPHERKRLWLVAYADSVRQLQPQGTKQDKWGRSGDSGQEKNLAYAAGEGLERVKRSELEGLGDGSTYSGQAWWGSDPADDPESRLGRMAHGVANRVDRLKAIGNGQVPAVAAIAFLRLYNDIFVDFEKPLL